MSALLDSHPIEPGASGDAPYRVLHLVPAAPFGGAQRLAIDLAVEQRRNGLGAGVLFLNGGAEAMRAAREAGLPATQVSRARLLTARRAVAEADLVHLHVAPPWIAAALPKGTVVVLHLHVRPTLQVHRASLRRYLDAVAEGMLLARADRLIAISEWVAAAWRRAHPRCGTPFSVVYNGVTLRPDNPRPTHRESFTIAMACRLADRKGVEEFIELAARLHAQAPDVVFRIAGDGPLRGLYEDAARAAGLGGMLTFEGFVTDMAGFWAGADLAAFTPPFEPFGLRLIEPVAHGVPALAYLNGSGSDEVVARCRGIAAARYGDAGALAAEALALRANTQRLAWMADAGREDVARHFSLAEMAAGVAAAYRAAGEWQSARA